MAEHLEEDQVRLRDRYRQRIEAAWPGLGNRPDVAADGKCRVALACAAGTGYRQ
jgi:hypothetical protein